jgi:hypothetical protein
MDLVTEADDRRWQLCLERARELFEDDEEAVQGAARVLFFSEIPTDPPED